MFNPSFKDFVPAGGQILGEVITNQLDPQLGYMWEVTVESTDSPKDFERSIKLFARNCTIPQRSVEEMNREFIGEPVSHPGYATDPKQIRATFWDDKRLIAYRYFNDWMNNVSDPEYGRQATDKYIRRKVIMKLKDRSDFFLGLEIVFTNAYIFNIGDVTLSYDESIPFLFNVGIRYDDMIINGTNYALNEVNATGNPAVDLFTSLNNKLNDAVEDVGDTISDFTSDLF